MSKYDEEVCFILYKENCSSCNGSCRSQESQGPCGDCCGSGLKINVEKTLDNIFDSFREALYDWLYENNFSSELTYKMRNKNVNN